MNGALADKIAKLLRLACSTGPDGEKLASLNRLSALVVVNDIDWDQALGASNGHDLTQQQLSEVYQAGIKAGVEMERQAKTNGGGDWANAAEPRADEVGSRINEVKEILQAAAQAKDDGLLTGWFVDSGFLDSTQEKIDRWGNRAFISERMWECLNKLRSILERQDYL
jgi:hypothetical protein